MRLRLSMPKVNPSSARARRWLRGSSGFARAWRRIFLQVLANVLALGAHLRVQLKG